MKARCSVIHSSFNPSSMLVTFQAKKNANFISDREVIMVIFPEFEALLQDPGYFGPELEVEIKNPSWQSFCPPWY